MSVKDGAPFFSGKIEVDGFHKLHVEQAGNPDGLPVVFLHGGPGCGCEPEDLQLFDHEKFRVVLFDQRGSGRSEPRASLFKNTTADLVNDIEVIRERLEIDRWMVVGGSWGAFLALAYAEAYPQRVAAMVLRSVFLGSWPEVDWAFAEGPRIFYPDLWAAFVSHLPEPERCRPLMAYGRRLMDPDPSVHEFAAHVWGEFEAGLSELDGSEVPKPYLLNGRASKAWRLPPASPYFEWHYFKNQCFVEPGQLLKNADRLDAIPACVIQGRYDMLCPPTNAFALCARWRCCELLMIESAGHSLLEPRLLAAMVETIDGLSAGL